MTEKEKVHLMLFRLMAMVLLSFLGQPYRFVPAHRITDAPCSCNQHQGNDQLGYVRHVFLPSGLDDQCRGATLWADAAIHLRLDADQYVACMIGF